MIAIPILAAGLVAADVIESRLSYYADLRRSEAYDVRAVFLERDPSGRFAAFVASFPMEFSCFFAQHISAFSINATSYSPEFDYGHTLVKMVVRRHAFEFSHAPADRLRAANGSNLEVLKSLHAQPDSVCPNSHPTIN